MASTEASAQTIDAVPKAGQAIIHQGKEYTTFKEGLAYILAPHGTPTSTDPKASKEDIQRQQVFYNPIQQFNRDLSVLAIKTFGQDLIQRKTLRHEQQKKKGENKKQRAREKQAAAEGSTANGTIVTEEAPSKKRKLAGEDTDEGAAPSKKQRVAESEAVEGEGLAAAQENSADQNGAPTPWQPPFSILDALSASGLRALRYAQEIPFATAITANDMSQNAVDSIGLNIKHNKLEDKIRPRTGNAIAYMYSYCDKRGYDVIDLDPYGTAAPFIDAAIQAINDEGLLCVTCTDSAIFASHGYLEKTYSQYGGLPFKGEPCHEGGLRLILHAIATSAGRYGMAMEPLLSLSIDYYIRVFVRIRKSPNDVKLLAGKTMIVYHCEHGCGAWSTQFLARNKLMSNKKGDPMYKHGFAQGPSVDQQCEHCGFKTHLSGPMYGGPLHNVGFIERVLAQLNEVDRETYPTMDRLQGMLHTALEEITFGLKSDKVNGKQNTQMLDPLIPKADPAEIDPQPFFIIPSTISRVVHCSAPPAAALRGALRQAGFKVTMSHCKPGSIKTNAGWKDIWHILLEWVRQRAPLKNPLKEGSAGNAIMAKATASGHFQKAPSETMPVEPVPEGDSSDPMVDVQKTGGGAIPASAPSILAQQPAYGDINYEVKFDERLGRDLDRGKYVRYQLAPRENWGPMAKAKGSG